MKIPVDVASVFGCIVLIVAVAGFVPGVWLCDIASQFRLVYTLLLMICLAVLLMGRACLRAVLLCLGTALVALPVVTMYVPRQCPPNHAEQVITLLNFNTEFQHNDQMGPFKEIVEKDKPDIIALVEVNQKWLDGLNDTLQPYPYNKIAMYGPGMALYSKLPIIDTDVRFFGRSHHPRILCTIRLNNRLIRLEVVHPHTPSADGYNERNEEFTLIRDDLKNCREPVILVGDFNCGPWSPAFRTLIEAGLQDSEQGFGPQPSWPARTGRVVPHLLIPPLIPIDHVLVSSDVCVKERVTGPPLQSDHLPVFVKLALPTLR